MSKSIQKIIYSVKEQLSGYNITDDNNFDDEFLEDKADDIRLVLLREEFERRGYVHDDYYQPLCCLEIKCQEQTCAVDGIDVSSGETYLYVDVPNTIPGLHGAEIKYFGLADLKTPFSKKSFGAFQNSIGNRYTFGDPMYTLYGTRAIVKNLPDPDTKFLCMFALLSKPNTGCDYDKWNTPYPVPDVFKLEMLLKKDLLSTYGLPSDDVQDTAGGTVNPKQAVQAQKAAGSE